MDQISFAIQPVIVLGELIEQVTQMIVITYLISLNILFPLYFFTDYREYSVWGTLMIFDMSSLFSSEKFAGA